MAGIFQGDPIASRASYPDTGPQLGALRRRDSASVESRQEKLSGTGSQERFSQPGSQGPRGPPVVQLRTRSYLYYTLLPWVFFLIAFVSFTFSIPSLEPVPFVVAAVLIVFAGLLGVPHLPPPASKESPYIREDVVVCVGFVLSAAVFALFFHTAHNAAVGYVALVFGAGVAIVAGDVRLQGQREKKKTRMDFIPFWLCVLAVVTGSIAGYYNFSQHMVAYHSISNGREYVDVLAREKADGVGDFGKIIFADESRVETLYSVGYKQRSTYCVAPILEAGQTEVEFWAVGTNCCLPRGGFWCTASSAYSIVTSQIASKSINHLARYTAEEFWVLDNGNVKAAVPFVKRPFSDGWDVYGTTEVDGLSQARTLAKEVYHLTESKNARMVLWTSNPNEVESNLLWGAWTSLCLQSFAYLVVCMALAFCAPKSFEEIRPLIVPMRFDRK